MAAGWRFTRAAVSVFLVLSVTHAGFEKRGEGKVVGKPKLNCKGVWSVEIFKRGGELWRNHINM
eukprot:271783-Amorphochlora_amoeboformis.AAC.1